VADKNIAARDRLIFAMDVPDCGQARKLAEELGDSVNFYKLGLELMMTGEYFELMDWMLARDKKVFADLKFFDIPATVGAAVRGLRNRGATLVTVLTSLDRGDLDDLGFDCDVAALVLSRARRALETGCDGVISSGLEAPKLREHIDHKLLVVTPGIRPVDNKPTGDQKRVVSVEQAFANGADHIVVGRPIRDAGSPRAAAESIQATIAGIYG
jgi:orotidine-5'-phosphate decarboxylase